MKEFWTDNKNIIFTLSTSIILGTMAYYYYSTHTPQAKQQKFLDGTRKKLKLVSKTVETPDTYLFKFSFQNESFGLPLGYHVRFFAPKQVGKVPGQWNGTPNDDSTELSRKYTPISHNIKDYAEFMIKIYRKDNHPLFADGGRVSQYLETLSPGDELDVEGPIGKQEYLGQGVFSKGGKTYKFSQLALIAGGTGIAPHYQLMSVILNDPNDNTKLSLLYASQSEDDIILKKQLDQLKSKHPDQLKMTYTVDRAPPNWKHESGYITSDMIVKSLPPPSQDTLVLICGPPKMKTQAVFPNLEKLGYSWDNLWTF